MVENPEAGDIGSDRIACNGDQVTLSSNTTEGDLQWEQSSDGATWTAIGSANTSSYTTPALTSNVHYRLVASVTGCGNEVSDAVEIQVFDNPVSGTISGPSFLCSGSSGALTLAGESGIIQFQESLDGTTWNNIPGATSNVLNLSAPSQSKYYRAVVSKPHCGSENTAAHQVEIREQPEAGDIGVDQSVCSGGTITLTTDDSEGDLVWEQAPSGTFSAIAGANNESYTSGSLTQTTQFRLRASVTGCGSDVSNTITVSVEDNPVGGTISGPNSACIDSDATLTLSGEVGNIQWQENVSGSWNNIAANH